MVQLVRIEVEQQRGEPCRQAQRSRERLLLDCGKRLDDRAVAQVLRDVRVLAEEQHVLGDERQRQGGTDRAEERQRSGREHDKEVERREQGRVTNDPRAIVAARKHAPETRQVPVVAGAVGHGEEWNPAPPAGVDERPLEASARPRRELHGRRIDVLPSGPAVMAPVDGRPRRVRHHGERRRDMAGERVQAARAEQCSVPAFVQQREPLEERDRQRELAGRPRHQAGT